MRETIKNTGLTQAARARAKAGGTRPEAVCKEPAEGKDKPAFTADSIFTIKFEPKKGPEVFLLIGIHAMEEVVDFSRLLKDVYSCYVRAKLLITGEQLSVDLTAAGLNESILLFHILTEFEKLLPKNVGFNIDYDNEAKKFHLTCFKECCGVAYNWHCFEIKHVVAKLKNEFPALHELFLSFIKLFTENTGVCLWNDGYMGSTLDMLPERLEEIKAEYGEKLEDDDYDDTVANIKEMEDDIEIYYSGIAREYALLISNAARYEPKGLIHCVQQLENGGVIADLICQGCLVMLGGHKIDDYRYWENPGDEHEMFYVDIDSQFNILWDISDSATREHEESIDATANEGIMSFINHLQIKPDTEKIDFNAFEAKGRWPAQLSRFFTTANDLITKYLGK